MPLEKNLDEKIRKYIKKTKGIWGFKVHGSVFQRVGIPDWIICYKGRFVGVECKLPDKPLQEIQKYIQREIRKAGGIVERIDNMKDFLALLLTVE